MTVCVCMIQVLATDMSKHLDHLAHLKTMVETYRLSGGSTTLRLCDGSERLQVNQTTSHLQVHVSYVLESFGQFSVIEWVTEWYGMV